VNATPPVDPQGQHVTDSQVSRDLIQITAGGDVSVHPRPVVRSAYLEQVKRIAPRPRLLGREDELEELAAFCSATSGGSYLSWEAEAWAGKTALMAWFVLHPPSNVDVVSFFVTARFAGQADRIAFTEVVLEQIAALVGQDLPAFLTPATRESHLLRMLAEAARTCRNRGRRLVLVVDGLDEDRGVTAGSDSYSIAALLPEEPEWGLRVIVARRPHPPIPADVPHGHPLRDPSTVRRLTRSEHAQVIRVGAERDLQRLLEGNHLEQDLLGMITAAGGGLTATDLAALTNASEYEIDRNLHAVSGRTFVSRLSQWQPRTASEAYILAHAELEDTATHVLGPRRLTDYRNRLHTWADSFAASWPPETPEYLFHGYFRMLQAAGDSARLIACASDRVRHDRMLDITGGDTTALAEIAAAQEVILAQREPDLIGMTRLTVHHDEITLRNRHIPIGLPSVWALLNRTTRAENLAHAIPNLDSRASALTAVAKALAAAGQHAQVAEIAAQAERILGRQDCDADIQASLLSRVARALAAAGQNARAAEAARKAAQAEKVGAAAAHDDPMPHTGIPAAVAGALAAAGLADEAEAFTISLPRHEQEYARQRIAEALAEVAKALAAGERARAAGVAVQAEDAAKALPDQASRAEALAAAAEALAAAGQHARAAEVAGQAKTATDAIPQGETRGWKLVRVAQALIAAGQREHATEVAAEAGTTAHSLEPSNWRDSLLAKTAATLVLVKQYGQAEEAIDAVTDPYIRVEARTQVARALAIAGDHTQAARMADQAETAARLIPDSSTHAPTLTSLAEALSTAGQHGLAMDVAARAMTATSAVHDEYQRAALVSAIACVMAVEGQHAQAEAAALSIPDANGRARALTDLTKALAAAGQHSWAKKFAAHTEATAWSISEPMIQKFALADASVALAAAGEFERAQAAARLITEPPSQAKALAEVAKVLAAAGQYVQAAKAAADAVAVAQSLPRQRAGALPEIAEILAAAGQSAAAGDLAIQAETDALLIRDTGERAKALARAAKALAAAGQHARAKEVAAKAEAAVRSMPDLKLAYFFACEDIAVALAAAGNLDQAEIVARLSPDTALQERAFVEIAETMAAAGEPGQAETAAKMILTRSRRADALARVAKALAAAGQQRRAAEVAIQAEIALRGASDLAREVWTLENVASALVDAGEPKRALYTTALILKHGGLQDALQVLASVEPAALLLVADLFDISAYGETLAGKPGELLRS
jgi:hypothetical protein